MQETTCRAQDPVLIPGSGRSPGEGNGNHSWEIPQTGAWWATVHGVRKDLATKLLLHTAMYVAYYYILHTTILHTATSA